METHKFETTLDVAYLTQPTSNTCQSTCLKMFGLYLESRLHLPSVIQKIGIREIWREINKGKDRPSTDRNSHKNMVWWLSKYFPNYNFSLVTTEDTDEVVSYVRGRIDSGFPVIVSTSHERTLGHFVLIVGYVEAEGDQMNSVRFVCHDPYGKFNPQLNSKAFGRRRYEGGMSLLTGGEVGPGKGVIYDRDGIGRVRSDAHSAGIYFMISGTETP